MNDETANMGEEITDKNDEITETKDEPTKSYKDRSVWMRGLYMLIFAFFLGVAKVVIFAVVFFQFLTVLFTAEPNKRLISFGQSLSTYQYQIMIFLTYNSEEHPFPMGDWPEQKKIADK